MRHLRRLGLVPETGLEPVRLITRPRILSPLRLPFHHSGSSCSLSNRAPRGNAPQFASRYILTALSYPVLVCLPTCGHGSGNGTPCAGRAICASFAPLGVYIYAVGGESCATRLPLLRSVPLRPEPWPRMAPLVEFVAQRRTSASLPLPAPSLPASSRRYAPQCFVGGIPPSRLATCTTAHPPNRAVACRSARHSARHSASSLHVKPLQAAATATN